MERSGRQRMTDADAWWQLMVAFGYGYAGFRMARAAWTGPGWVGFMRWWVAIVAVGWCVFYLTVSYSSFTGQLENLVFTFARFSRGLHSGWVGVLIVYATLADSLPYRHRSMMESTSGNQ